MKRLIALLSALTLFLAAPQDANWQTHFSAGEDAMNRGNFLEARRCFHLAAGALRSVSSSDERHLATANRLGIVYTTLGDLTWAEHWFRRALEDTARSGTGDVATLAITQANLANVYRLQRRTAKADQICRQALDLLSRESAPSSYALAHVLGALSMNSLVRGDLSAAEKSLTEATRLARNFPPHLHRLEHQILSNLGALYLRQGKREKALSTFQHSCHLIRTRYGNGHPDLFDPLKEIAILQAAAGDYAAALASFDAAVGLAEKSRVADHPALADALELQAKILRKMKRKDEARPLERRAAAIRRSIQITDPARHTVDIRDLAQP